MTRAFLVENSKYSRLLQKMEFPPNMCTSEYQSERWANFCKKSNMKFLKGSYGTIVHKEFDKYFKKFKGIREEDIFKKVGVYDEFGKPTKIWSMIDHSNALKSNVNGIVMVTSSTRSLIFSHIKDYPYRIYMINPNFLEDYTLSGKINIAFTNANFEEIDEINRVIHEDTGIHRAFIDLLLM